MDLTMPPTDTVSSPEDRAAMIAEIEFCEQRIAELRAILPSPIKQFFRFRTRPQKYVMVYAASRAEADKKLKARMDTDYPADPTTGNPGWELASPVVDQYDTPEMACAACASSLLTSLNQADASEFLDDYAANEVGRDKSPKLKHAPASQLALDIEHYRLRQSSTR